MGDGMMQRPLSILLLVLLVGCASPESGQVYWDTQRAFFKSEQQQSNEIYRAAFARAFSEAWTGKDFTATSGCTFGDLSDSEVAQMKGIMDGRRAGVNARLAFESERTGKAK